MKNREIKFRAFQDNHMLTMPMDGCYSAARFFNMLYEDTTLMQFTGLKDKNRKDIYEGDIIKHGDKKFVCKWTQLFGYCFVQINKNLGTFHLDGVLMASHNRRLQYEISNYIKHAEVIGNIYDNPELLVVDILKVNQ